MEYQVGRIDRQGLTPPYELKRSTNILSRRARGYEPPEEPRFQWKIKGGKYTVKKSLMICIEGIRASARRNRQDHQQDSWLLKINRPGKRDVILTLNESIVFAPAPSVGTCPLVAWHKEAFSEIPGLRSLGIYNCRSVAGSSTPSQHSYANAEDPTHDKFSEMERLAKWTVANAKRLKVHNVIFDRKIWTSEGQAWRSYSGENPHVDHVHVDFLPALSGSCRASTC